MKKWSVKRETIGNAIRSFERAGRTVSPTAKFFAAQKTMGVDGFDNHADAVEFVKAVIWNHGLVE